MFDINIEWESLENKQTWPHDVPEIGLKDHFNISKRL